MAKMSWQDNAVDDTATGDMPEIAVKEYTTTDLWQQAWSEAGKSLFYMQFLHSNDDMFARQKVRIEQMCYHLAVEWNNHYKDTSENRNWFKKWLEDFGNEIENMC